MLKYLLAGLALWCTATLPAIADSPQPVPQVGEELTPTARLICTNEFSLPIIFREGSDAMIVKRNIEIMKRMMIEGKPACIYAAGFLQPVTVIDVQEVGKLLLPNEQEFTAFAVHSKFADGEEIWALWFEQLLKPSSCDDCI